MKQLIITVFIIFLVAPIKLNSGVISKDKQKETFEVIQKWRTEQDSIKSLNSFLELLAFKESNMNWYAINQYGYVGKYQFGSDARRDVGVKKFTWKQFQSNPSIWPEKEQDKAVIRFMKLNHKKIFSFFDQPGDHLINDHFNKVFKLKYNTKWYKKGETVQLTWAGLYAACHLVGPGHVRKFLNTGYNHKDGNGITTFDYLKYFSKIDMKPIS